jgi:hypothetical protein
MPFIEMPQLAYFPLSMGKTVYSVVWLLIYTDISVQAYLFTPTPYIPPTISHSATPGLDHFLYIAKSFGKEFPAPKADQ